MRGGLTRADPVRAPPAFGPFGTRSFRFQCAADLFTSWAFEMETLILAWYVMVHTGSVLLLTVFGSLQLVLMGIVQSFTMISMAVSLLSASDDRFRGRVMGVRTLAVYGLPIGLMASGALGERIGFPATVTLYSAVGLLFTALIGSKWRASMWRA